jgi:hypothetical protein
LREKALVEDAVHHEQNDRAESWRALLPEARRNVEDIFDGSGERRNSGQKGRRKGRTALTAL